MKRLSTASTLALAATTALVLSPLAGFGMGNEISQLQLAVEQNLSHMQIDSSNVSHVTLAQLAEIKLILDQDGPDNQATDRINHILGNDGPHMDQMTMLTTRKGHTKSQLELAVINDLNSIGVKVDNPDALTVAQLVQIKDLFDSNDKAPSTQVVHAILGM